MHQITEQDRVFLKRAVDLARQAADEGSQPFGSVLVDANGEILFEDHNHAVTGDPTQHPEFAIARWAAANVAPEDRASCTVYTSGEHCPMCSAAHAQVGLGRIVYASSGDQLRSWRREWHLENSMAVAPLPINAVAPTTPVAGPDPSLTDELRAVFARCWGVTETE